MEREGTYDLELRGEGWLPGFPAASRRRVTDVLLERFCQLFCEKCPPEGAGPLPAELDDLSLACVLVAAEWGEGCPESTSEYIATCLDKVAGRFWGDRLPWRLALEFCGRNPDGVSALAELTVNLDHQNASIRLWMFELAWCVRDRLNPVEATGRLLKNVADTLGHWDAALGLCRGLYPTDEAFWKAAAVFQPKDFAEQYRDRMDLAREKGLAGFLQHFERMELRLRRQVCRLAFGIKAD